jgi:hypothetical protein
MPPARRKSGKARKVPVKKAGTKRRRPTTKKRRTVVKKRKTVRKRKSKIVGRKIKRVTKRRSERPGPPQSAKLAHPSDTARGNDGRTYHIGFRRRNNKRYQVWVSSE